MGEESSRQESNRCSFATDTVVYANLNLTLDAHSRNGENVSLKLEMGQGNL